MPGTIRDTHRLREISVQATIEGSASARLGRALNTRTTMAAQSLNLQVGEEVDFYQDQANKDTPGWFGPATVIDASRSDVITVRYNNKPREVELRKVRRHLHFLVFLASQLPITFGSVWRTIRLAVESLDEGSVVTLGYVKHKTDYAYTKGNQKFPGLLEAVRHFASNHLHIPPVLGVRLGLGAPTFSQMEGYAGALTLTWLCLLYTSPSPRDAS